VPLIAIHGNGVDHRLLLPLDDALATGGWERIYVDLPGFGGTPPLANDGGLPDLAEWLRGAVDELVGDSSFGLLANSLGGVLARHVAASMPGRVLGMALIAPVVDPVVANRRLPERAVLERDGALLATLAPTDASDFAEMAVIQTRESWERFAAAALPGIRAANPDAMDRLARRYELDAVPEDVTPVIPGATLIVTGRQDHVVGYEDQLTLLSHYPRATVATIDRAGHNVHLEQPELVEALLRDWSDRVLGPARK
jgi:pimeloyl-ACP methyl ester carboxylesterase